MMRAYWSEWLKLWRPRMILGSGGSMIGFAVLALVLTLSRVGSSAGGPGVSALSAGQVAATNGFSQLIATSTTFMGVVALAVFAMGIGMEYVNGTLRNLLVRQPHRLLLLGGKLLATASFVAGAAILAFGAAFLAAVLLTPSHGISTAAWFTGAGLRSLLATLGNLLLSTLAWGVMGAAAATVLRSTTAAIVGGLAYALVVEVLLSAAWSGGKQWLPGELMRAVAQGGTPTVTYTWALTFVGAYAVVALGLASRLFWVRDVAA